MFVDNCFNLLYCVVLIHLVQNVLFFWFSEFDTPLIQLGCVFCFVTDLTELTSVIMFSDISLIYYLNWFLDLFLYFPFLV